MTLFQIYNTGNLDSSLIFRQYKLELMARFMEFKSLNPKLGKNQTAKELGFSSSISQQYRNDINMLSLYIFPPNSQKRKIEISNEDLNRPQMTSKDVKTPQLT